MDISIQLFVHLDGEIRDIREYFLSGEDSFPPGKDIAKYAKDCLTEFWPNQAVTVELVFIVDRRWHPSSNAHHVEMCVPDGARKERPCIRGQDLALLVDGIYVANETGVLSELFQQLD